MLIINRHDCFFSKPMQVRNRLGPSQKAKIRLCELINSIHCR